MATANLSVRVDAELKKDVENCLDEIGMSMSTAINIYLRQIAKRRAIPFAVTANPVPNDETSAAIEEGERIACDPHVRGYRDMNSLIRDLNS
ncbi:MAG: type II toxin-antitoxin system RelB/DinJ family antitoxin [Lentisphaerae bacterium]|jgi:DNA-damage-inducible protein J|nr:type II toxin-antitoxin system RelB/DinJ family antitoxin [Lentisphaerota bacterium]